MVHVKIEGAYRVDDNTINRIKKTALGRKTTTGEKFELITVIHRATPGQRGATSRPKGYQDVTILRPAGTNDTVIELGDEGGGALELIGNDLGEYVGHLPRTKHNLKMLSMHHNLYRTINGAKTRWFEYEDESLEKEIEALYEEHKKNQTEEERESSKQIEWDIDHMPSERPTIKKQDAMDVVTGKVSADSLKEKLAGDPEAEKRILALEVAQLEEKKRKLLEDTKPAPKEEPKDVPIEQMKRGALMKLAKEMGITVRTTDKKEGLLEKIRGKHENKADDKPPSGESVNVHETGAPVST